MVVAPLIRSRRRRNNKCRVLWMRSKGYRTIGSTLSVGVGMRIMVLGGLEISPPLNFTFNFQGMFQVLVKGNTFKHGNFESNKIQYK
jgi:hypothetical protein